MVYVVVAFPRTVWTNTHAPRSQDSMLHHIYLGASFLNKITHSNNTDQLSRSMLTGGTPKTYGFYNSDF